MNRISRAGSCLERSKIRLFFERQGEIAKTCDDMISFTIGEPDFIAPPNVEDACVAAIRAGKTKYAPNAGLWELKVAVSNKVKEIYGKTYDPQTEIVITPSGMDSLRLIFQAILDAGEEVLVADPTWSNHPNHPELAGGKSVRVPVYEKNNFTYAIEDLEKALTPRTKAILLNTPSNPTGAVIQHEDIIKICEFAKAHNLFIVSDEVYYRIIFDGQKFWSPAMMDGMKDLVIISQSFSKTYAMTGWRLGYVAGPKDVVEAVGKINENSISCVNTAVQWAGVEALTNPITETYLYKMVAEFQRRRDVVYQMINEIDGLSCVKPQGAFYAFINIRDTGMTSEEFSNKLLEKKHVGMVPGTGFGASGEGFVRLSYATTMENIVEGIKRIKEFVQEERKKG